jgi:hypothetical protein
MIHELRTYRMANGAGAAAMESFFCESAPGSPGGGYRDALRDAKIPFLGAWRAAQPDGAEDFVWIRAFENEDHKKESTAKLYASAAWRDGLKARADEIIENFTSIDLTPLDAAELLRGPRDRGFHELRHYRLASNAMPKMLAFFEDVRRLVPRYGVRVLAWWAAESGGSERFLWLREFESADAKARISKELYESQLWLTKFKPRAAGVIEERILTDLEPIPGARVGGYDARV